MFLSDAWLNIRCRASCLIDADAYTTLFIEALPTDSGLSRWQQRLATCGVAAAGGQDFSAAMEYFDGACNGFTDEVKTALRLRAADLGVCSSR